MDQKMFFNEMMIKYILCVNNVILADSHENEDVTENEAIFTKKYIYI